MLLLTVAADVVLVSVGRRPYLEKLGIKEVGVKLDEKGRVKVDDHFRTNIPKCHAKHVVRTSRRAASMRLATSFTAPCWRTRLRTRALFAWRECSAATRTSTTTTCPASSTRTRRWRGSARTSSSSRHRCGAPFPQTMLTAAGHRVQGWCVQHGGQQPRAHQRGDCRIHQGHWRQEDRPRARRVHDQLGAASHFRGVLSTDVQVAGELINEAALAMEYGASCEDIARVCHAHPV